MKRFKSTIKDKLNSKDILLNRGKSPIILENIFDVLRDDVGTSKMDDVGVGVQHVGPEER